MGTVYMNSKNNKTFGLFRLLLNVRYNKHKKVITVLLY